MTQLCDYAEEALQKAYKDTVKEEAIALLKRAMELIEHPYEYEYEDQSFMSHAKSFLKDIQ